jgi:hypothetical protein
LYINQFAEEVASGRAAIRDRMADVNPGSSLCELHRNSIADVIISGWGQYASSTRVVPRSFFVPYGERGFFLLSLKNPAQYKKAPYSLPDRFG